MKRLSLAAALLALPLSVCLADEASYVPAGDRIMTRWAAEVGPATSHQEYPRIQMVRREWKNLNGLWEYAVCDGAEPQMPSAQGNILVPFCLESALGGVGGSLQPDQALWYRRCFSIPASWDGSRVLLHFDAVDYECTVFIDGTPVGSHKGGYTAFDFDVTQYLRAGAQAELKLKVTDPSDTRRIPRGKQHLHPSGIWYTPVSGIWQTVWLEAVSAKAYIKDYNVVSDIANGTLTVSVDCVDAAPGDEVKVDVLRPKIGYNPEKPGWALFRKGHARVGVGEDAVVKLRRPRLWTPDSPYLYGLRISLLRDGKVVDRVQGYTAMRSIGTCPDENGTPRLSMNGDILFQFGPLDQGWWPDGLYTAPTDEALAFDVQATKDLGMNMIRKHIKVEPARWYYHCDRLGMIVWQDMPCIENYSQRDVWGQGIDRWGAGRDEDITPEEKDNYYKEWGEVVAQLKKFPCIGVWVPFNEAWGQFDTQAVVDFTTAQDPTRLVNASSGGNWIKGAGDIVDSHHYSAPRMRILDSTKVNVLGEYGGIGYPVSGHLWQENKNWGYVQFSSTEEVTDRYTSYLSDLERLKKYEGCAAAVYTQTTDVEIEVNGFYTYDREVLKMNKERVREGNRAVIDAPCTGDIRPVSAVDFAPGYDKAGKVDGRKADLFTIENGSLTMQVTPFGARVISLYTPDRNGVRDDIVVGYDRLDRYVNNSGERFFGAIVGRVANRIGGARFTLDGKRFRLSANDGANTLHGGLKGVDMMVWNVLERTDSSILLGCKLPDGQDGFPGNLQIRMAYTLLPDDALEMSYYAETDAPTVVNLSNHAFFNLKGKSGGTILDHFLQINADAITPVDSHLIPTGEFMNVEGTPFDFREPRRIGERIAEDNEQLRRGGGYDHNWCLRSPKLYYEETSGQFQTEQGYCHLPLVATLSEETTGRSISIYSDQAGLQFYSGNFFDGSYPGKLGGEICGARPDAANNIGYREALALETQMYPDSPNHSIFPSIVLRPGETYGQKTIYKFSAK